MYEYALKTQRHNGNLYIVYTYVYIYKCLNKCYIKKLQNKCCQYTEKKVIHKLKNIRCVTEGVRKKLSKKILKKS